MEKELKIEVPPGGGEFVLRIGDALPAREPEVIRIVGTITAPTSWIEKQPSGDASYVAISTTENKGEIASITFYQDGNDPYSTTVKGILELEPRLNVIGINSTQRYHREQFVSFLRLHRMYFPDMESHAKLLSSVKNFKAEVKQEVEQRTNDRGNRGQTFNQAVQTDILTDFILKLPVFKGEAEKSFRVELCFDITDGSVRFWLESPELLEIIESYRKEIIEREAGIIKQKGITIIYL